MAEAGWNPTATRIGAFLRYLWLKQDGIRQQLGFEL
jgi:hypothetical protein